MISDAEFLERLVAGFCAADMEDADVVWDQKIGGRQFDVVINHKAGIFNYTTLIEVKSSKSKLKVKEIEAFIVKSKDAGANKISIFSANGYEAGCLDVARRHLVDLFVIRLAMDVPTPAMIESRMAASEPLIVVSSSAENIDPPNIEFGEKILATIIEKVELIDVEGRSQALSTESTELLYLITHSNLVSEIFEGDVIFLREFIESIHLAPLSEGQKSSYKFPFDCAVRFLSIDDLMASDADVVEIEITYSTEMAINYVGNVRIEPSTFGSDVVVENVLTGEISRKYFHQLALGFSEFEAGKFYVTLEPLTYYYCEQIRGDLALIFVLESFQVGDFLHGSFWQELKYGRLYLPLRDKKVIERLKTRYERELAGGPFIRHLPLRRPARDVAVSAA